MCTTNPDGKSCPLHENPLLERQATQLIRTQTSQEEILKRSSLFGILGLGHPYIVVYYPGGNEEYAFLSEKEAECTLQKVFECNNSGNYSIKEDLQENDDLKWQIIKGRKEGSYAIER